MTTELEQFVGSAARIVLTTLGIDVGSATSHLAVSQVVFVRQGSRLTSELRVGETTVLYESPILLTPYLEDTTIDAVRLEAFVRASLADAGVGLDAIDSGVVLLTGAALEKHNARAVSSRLASLADGGLLCAAAGHQMEATLAAHGAGAVALSAEEGGRVVLVDVGGATTKLVLVEDGVVAGVRVLGIGSRIVAFDEGGILVRRDERAVPFLRELGVATDKGEAFSPEAIEALADRLAAGVVAGLAGERDPATEWLLDTLGPGTPLRGRVVLSGGSSEYLVRGAPGGDADAPMDLGPLLAPRLAARLHDAAIPMVVADRPIRATVFGAARSTVQLSGSSIAVSPSMRLPVANVPVVAVDLPTAPEADEVDAAIERAVAASGLQEGRREVLLALRWQGLPAHAQLRALAEGVLRSHPQGAPLHVATTMDVARSLGMLLTDELGFAGRLLVLDGLQLDAFDYVDVGDLRRAGNAVPVVVKSLLFPPVEHASLEPDVATPYPVDVEAGVGSDERRN